MPVKMILFVHDVCTPVKTLFLLMVVMILSQKDGIVL
jgi:hypothetical protein